MQRQQHERQQFTEEHRQAKDAQEKRKFKEKMDDLKQLKTYNPFGKPGFGAPRVSVTAGTTFGTAKPMV